MAISAIGGLVEGMEAIDTGATISIPVGEATMAEFLTNLAELLMIKSLFQQRKLLKF